MIHSKGFQKFTCFVLFLLIIKLNSTWSFNVPKSPSTSTPISLLFEKNDNVVMEKNRQIDTNNSSSDSIDDQELVSMKHSNDMSRRNFIHNTIGVSTAIMLSLSMKPGAVNAEGSLSSFTADTTTTTSNTNTVSTMVASSSTSTSSTTTPTFEEILSKASKRALSGGKAGASASIVQVLSLMWLRTSMNYQYRYGGTLSSSLDTLYKEGGIPRLYQGLPFALIQGPLTRFGDTAANVGILALLDSMIWAEGMPLPLKTLCGSIAAGCWRIFLMPIDTSKTVMQVEGKEGLNNLYEQVQQNGPSPLYRGAIASAAATAVGHFPWFLTYNYLNEVLPIMEGNGGEKNSMIIFMTLARSAFLGLAASCVSDCCSNSLRVIKTTKQTAGLDPLVEGDNEEPKQHNKDGSEISYVEAVQIILEKDGWAGLFGRGLQTRLLTNAIQGAVFSVLWRYFQEIGK